MLGRTNIMTIEEGTIASDVEEYKWINAAINDITGTFVKAIFNNSILVGITKDGTIAYSMDGENWETARLDLEGNYELNDIFFDGNRYIMVGGYQSDKTIGEVIYENVYTGMIVTTEYFKDFQIILDSNTDKSSSLYWTIRMDNGKYNIHCTRYNLLADKTLTTIFNMTELSGSLDSLKETKIQEIRSVNLTWVKNFLEICNIRQVKRSGSYLVYLKQYSPSQSLCTHEIQTITDNGIYNYIKQESNSDLTDIASIFECKDSLYYCMRNENYNYEFGKIIGEKENVVLTTNTNYLFIDGIYYNNDELFINDHQMLVIRKGESITDKTIEDLLDITYDFSMTAIVKAFEKIYIFGTGGNILISSEDVNSEDALAVKTMSARKALYDANAYTDIKISDLETRVAALEALTASSNE